MVIKLFNPFHTEASLYFNVFQYSKPMAAEHRSHLLKVFLGKGALKICRKFIGKHPCRSVISIKLQSSRKVYKKTLIPKGDFIKVAKQL